MLRLGLTSQNAFAGFRRIGQLQCSPLGTLRQQQTAGRAPGRKQLALAIASSRTPRISPYSTMTSTVRNGSCLCHKVRFTVEGDPFTFVVCHCSNCQKFAGSAFMTNAFFAPDKVTITEGQDFIKAYDDNDTTSGNTLTRRFCSNCGASLFLSSPVKTDWMTVCAVLVEGQEWVPRRENRPDAKCPWVTELRMEPKKTSNL
ncbi:DUF636 domain-containing protein [Mycena sanguinolenta]|uniref:DUF636 domain-containing protein n=1 Tax=Mycena sanguinolenta TaxID=230812 RepID=A0A8H6Z0K3_9AGAR|nr:DUF636 domain-containing protein [Mycena sanguinolenta]